ncbi:MAG: ABC transporter substrate-binding protein, partial [Chloroflexota bacterium]
MFVALTLLAACAPAPASPTVAAPSAPLKGGTFIDASFADGVSLQPLITSDNASSNYQALIWASLTRTDPKTLDRVGVLYEDKCDMSADGTKITCKLRKGLKWSDGKPITSADV